MGVYKYKMTDEMMRNLSLIEAEIGRVLKEINPAETTLEIDYSGVTNQEISATTGISMNKLIKVGFQKIVIAGWRNRDEFIQNSVLKLLIDRGQLEVK